MACCGFLILSDGEEGQAWMGGFHLGVLLCRLVMIVRVLRWTTSGLIIIVVLHLLTKYTLHGKTCRRPKQRRRRGRLSNMCASRVWSTGSAAAASHRVKSRHSRPAQSWTIRRLGTPPDHVRRMGITGLLSKWLLKRVIQSARIKQSMAPADVARCLTQNAAAMLP